MCDIIVYADALFAVRLIPKYEANLTGGGC